MAFAIIEMGGVQFKVEPGRFYDVNRLAHQPETTLSLDQVLLVHDGETLSIGQPLVKGATVEVTVMQHLRDRKILVYKMQPKKKTRKKQGHRQDLTRFMVNAIHLNGKAVGDTTAAKKPAQKSSTKESQKTEAAIAVEAEVVSAD
ncbi:MAG: 50S ribosomal protein L21 [Acaryochloridaceae cyanobacterium SU_2_1]|nr:50S ribosomal protein L21 [Acaryochloridaceae cyanobacterium SU_2_1]